MDITIHLSDEIGKQVAILPNRDEFLEGEVKKFLEETFEVQDIINGSR